MPYLDAEETLLERGVKSIHLRVTLRLVVMQKDYLDKPSCTITSALLLHFKLFLIHTVLGL